LKRRDRRAISVSIKSESVKGPPASSYTPYDSRKGHGYGTTDPKFDISYKSRSTYPYTDPPVEYEEEDSDVIDDIFAGDSATMDRFVRMINKNFVKTDPSNRADRASFVSNQRIRIPEASIGVRSNSISPIPKKTLYKSFDGPAVGGSSTNVAFNPGTYKRTGTQYGTSRAPLYFGDQEEDIDDDLSAYTLEDILHPDVKAVVKSRSRIRKKSG